MLSDRSSHYHPSNAFHSRGGPGSRSHGLGGLGASGGGLFDGMMFGGRPSLGGRQGSGRSGRIGFGREGGVRLDNTPMLRRRRGSMSELMNGMRQLNLGGDRLRGDRHSGDRGNPLLGRSPLGSYDSLLFGRSPFEDDLLGGLGARRGPLPGQGMGMSRLGSRESLRSARAELLGGGLLGRGSQLGSSRASSIFDLHALDRPRMPYGPLDASLHNYRNPYVEDYFSEIDPEELLMMQEMDRRGILFWDEPHDDRLW